jgi:transposase
MESGLFMGCDIAQDSFTFCLRSSSSILLEGEVKNSTKAIRKELRKFEKEHHLDLSQILFCVEDTGVYGALLLRALSAESLNVCIVSARSIQMSLGLQRGKSDKVDAQRIAEYAFRFKDRLKPWRPRREQLERLRLLIRNRERLVNARKDLSRYLKDSKRFDTKEMYAVVLKGSKRTLQALQKDIKMADQDIKALISSDENLERLSRLVTSVDGIGMVTCSSILVKTNEFEDITDPKKFACTAGIAPFEHTSGSSVRGKTRVSKHAHKDLKALLHMCAIGCIRHEGELKKYYTRKVAEGKNKMLVINAIRNKLIHRVFAVVRDNTMYQKNYRYKVA